MRPTVNALRSYDWATMIEELVAAGVMHKHISGFVMTSKVIYHLRKGVQPLHWRGEQILTTWCKHFGKDRADAPMCEVTRGHRAQRRMDRGPRVMELPQWPPVEQPKRRGRKAREKADL